VALWTTTIIIQLIVITTYWSNDAFALMPHLTVRHADPVPVRRCLRPDDRQARRDLRSAAGRTPEGPDPGDACGGLHAVHDLRGRTEVHPAVGHPIRAGTILYYIARREQGLPVFAKTSDWVTFGVIVAAAIYGVFGIATGAISI